MFCNLNIKLKKNKYWKNDFLQKDYLVVSFDDLMFRYILVVVLYRYRVRFVLVVQKDSLEEERYLQCMFDLGWVLNRLRSKCLVILQLNQLNWSDILYRFSLEKK